MKIKEERRVVTVKIALKMLEKNVANRRLSESHVDFLAKQMLEGKWLFDGSPIRFNEKGDLLDGQHRLFAIIKSELSQEFLIVSGITQEAFKVMDTGKTRNASDVLSMEGIPRSSNVAACVKRILHFKIGENYQGVKRLTNTEIVDFVRTNPEIIKHVARYENQYLGFNKVLPLSTITALSYIMKERHLLKSEEFWDKVCFGFGLQKHSPMTLLRTMLINDKMANRKMSKMTKYGMIIKAWNLFRKEQTVVTLRFNPRIDKFPKII